MQAMRNVALAALFVVLAALGGAAWSAVSGIAANGVVFLSGGVGADEREEMASRGGEFDLVVWAAERGSCGFVVPERLWVTDPRGVLVFELAPEGPITYLHLGPGRYVVRATFNGVAESQAVVIPAVGRRNVYFYWPGAEAASPSRSNAR
ncbi:MAG: hypothetical protein N2544_09350 [Burkholderiales bacterium]|nr:hypothetical protein [Burkholderiales bacterium]